MRALPGAAEGAETETINHKDTRTLHADLPLEAGPGIRSDFRLVASKERDTQVVTFYVHPIDRNGQSLDFAISGDTVTCITPPPETVPPEFRSLPEAEPPPSELHPVIDAVIRAAAVKAAEPGLLVWIANAPEQIDAALDQMGYVLVKKIRVTPAEDSPCAPPPGA